MKQLLLNLIDNAIKYTPNGGKVIVKQFTKDNNIIIEVIDNGMGIPKEDQSKIFQRFYRVDKSRCRNTGGTGVGLTICKSIIDLHNGNIEVKSEVNKGSEFIVSIPYK